MPRFWTHRTSHRTRILALVVVSGLPVLMLAIFGLWRYLDAAKQHVVDDRVAMAQAAALSTQAFVADVTSSAQTLALSPGVTDPTQRDRLPTLLQTILHANPYWQQVAVFDASSSPLAVAGEAPLAPAQVSQSVAEALASGNTHVVVFDADGPRNAGMLVIAPIGFTDGSRGALVVAPSLRLLDAELRAQARGPQVDPVLVNRAGHVLIPPIGRPAWLSIPAVSSALQAEVPGAQQANGMLVAYAPVADADWSVVVVQPDTFAFADLEHQVEVAALALVAALGLAGCMAWLVGGRLSHYYERIIEARDRAEEATCARDAVLASISHDLQNPVAGAKGYLQLLQRRVALDPEMPARSLLPMLTQTQRAVGRIQAMAEELVDAARLEAGYQLTLRPALTDLRALVQQIVDEQTAATNGHEIHVEAEAAELWVVCDATRIARALANVVSNAVKYSPMDSNIHVHVRTEGDSIVLTVRDEGIGIPPEDLPHVFERFHRARNVSGRAGSGLGLPGVRGLVEQHGGNVAISSQPGVGTTVTIRLPRRLSDHKPAALPLAS